MSEELDQLGTKPTAENGIPIPEEVDNEPATTEFEMLKRQIDNTQGALDMIQLAITLVEKEPMTIGKDGRLIHLHTFLKQMQRDTKANHRTLLETMRDAKANFSKVKKA